MNASSPSTTITQQTHPTTATAVLSHDDESRLPPVQCPLWCEAGDGHTDVFHPDDQTCMSEARVVGLTAMPLVTWECEEEGRLFSYARLDTVSAYLLRERNARSATVGLCRGDSGVASLTLEEAREYALGILALVEEADSAVGR